MTPTPDTELMACPFCGGGKIDKIDYGNSGDAAFCCNNCGAEGPEEHTVLSALAAWNHRIASTRPDSALGDGERDYQAWCANESEPKGTADALALCATMLETYGPDCDPANDQGQVSFARAMMDSTAGEIRAFLASQPAPRADDALRDAAERLANAADGVAYTSKTAVMDDAIDAVRAALASEEPKRTQAVVPDFKLSDEAKAKIALIEDNMRMAPQRMREMGLAAYSDPPAAQADEDRQTMRWVKGVAGKPKP